MSDSDQSSHWYLEDLSEHSEEEFYCVDGARSYLYDPVRPAGVHQGEKRTLRTDLNAILHARFKFMYFLCRYNGAVKWGNSLRFRRT